MRSKPATFLARPRDPGGVRDGRRCPAPAMRPIPNPPRSAAGPPRPSPAAAAELSARRSSRRAGSTVPGAPRPAAGGAPSAARARGPTAPPEEAWDDISPSTVNGPPACPSGRHGRSVGGEDPDHAEPGPLLPRHHRRAVGEEHGEGGLLFPARRTRSGHRRGGQPDAGRAAPRRRRRAGPGAPADGGGRGGSVRGRCPRTSTNGPSWSASATSRSARSWARCSTARPSSWSS
jgi:hypothetical protein